MANETISQFPNQTVSDITNLYLTGIDLTKPAGSQNRKINASGMLAAYMAASSTETGATFTNHAESIIVNVGSHADTILYAPQVNTNDVAMVSLQFGQASIIPQPFYFQIYAGVPSGSGVLIYDSQAQTGTTIKTAAAYCASTIYVPAAAGNNTLYIRILNAGQSTMNISFQGVFIEFAGNGVALPTYVPPSTYLGPLMSTVHVGPTEQFTHPIFGLQALADGGTMILDDGHYYFPIALLNSGDPDIITNTYTFGGQTYNVFGGTSAHPSNRFSGGITIRSASGNPYNCVWDGLGGIGNGFRLAEGKGLILTHVPITIQGINFISAGGADGAGNGEAAVYSEYFLSPGTTTIENCGFDNCENGCLVPDVDTLNNGVWSQNNGAGVNVTLVLNSCDFGYNAGNGVTPDGLSHNFYCEGPSITVNNCHMYSAAVGNTQKCRGPVYTGINSYIEGGAGRALDSPEGGTVTFTGCTLAVTPNANSGFLDYNGEATTRAWRLSSFVNPSLTNCTVIGTRNPASQIWVNTPVIAYAFTNTTQQWYNQSQTPAFIPERVQSGYISDSTAVTGLFTDPTQGGTVLTVAPVRPGSIAQPGAVPTPFIAWNGEVSYTY